MIITLVLALVGSWFIVRAYVGNTLAEYLNVDEGGIEMSRRAVLLAPNDPLTHWTLGAVAQRRLPADQFAAVVREYEKAASLSPNDYRYWMSLGTALEQAGEVDRGERTLRRAVELAPSYSHPRWYLGNLLLRSGRYEEAFEELRRASEADATFQPQLFNSAWEVYKDDIDSLKSAVGSTAHARAAFSQYLVGLQRHEDGISLWKSLSEDEKRANSAAGEAIVTALLESKRYHKAATVANDLVPGAAYKAVEGNFVNGSFEENLPRQSGAVFGWQVTSTSQAQIAIDPAYGYNSARSLRIAFQVRSKLDSIDASQLVLVMPNTQYDFEYYVKTQKLESAETPSVAVLDAFDGSMVATSASAPPGTTDWQRVAVSFKTGVKTEAVKVRINRASCGQDAVCPIFGNVWYDAFNLKRRG